jgi:hypothetical protein
MGGSGSPAEATAEAAQTEAEATFESAEATANAVLDPDDNDNSGDDDNDNSGDDNDNANANDNSGDDNDNANANDNEDDNDNSGDDDFEFAPNGPSDIPLFVLDGDLEAEIILADESTLTYTTDGEFDDVLEFYRQAMIDLGWELSPNGDNVFGELASLQYEKSGDTAIIAITPDLTGAGNTLVTITVQ